MDTKLHHKATADEWYEFDGDPEYDKPPYWVARHGRTVTRQVEGRADLTKALELDDVEQARGCFADETCDPAGPGGIQANDFIRVVWGPREGARFRVESVMYRDDEYVFATSGHRSGPLQLAFGQYEILSRPIG